MNLNKTIVNTVKVGKVGWKGLNLSKRHVKGNDTQEGRAKPTPYKRTVG
jgi:hypothetical protein